MDYYISKNLSFSLLIREYIYIGKMEHVMTDLDRSVYSHHISGSRHSVYEDYPTTLSSLYCFREVI
jgi:hypothetical protein